MKAAELFVKALENEGVEYIFGMAGEENLHFLEALAKSKQIKYVPVRHEQAAGFMAATYGRLTGKPGVVLTTLGPGATNLFTSIAYAYLGAMPLVILTGQKPIDSSPQGHFQIVGIVDMMKPVTKFAEQIVHGNTIPSLVRQAFRVAEEERPGPVHLELPKDVALEETSSPVLPVPQTRRPVAEEKAISWAVDMIEKAKRPLILVGAGANRKRVAKMLNEFVQKFDIPVFSTQMGKGVIDERNEYFIGTAALSKNDYIHCAIDRADLIINVGHDVIEKPPFIMEGEHKKVIHINFYPATVDEVYFPQVEVIGDIANAIWQIKTKLKKQSTWDFDYYKRMREKLEAHTKEKTDSDSFPVLPQRIVSTVREVMPEDGILALDNGMYKLWFTRNYKAYMPNSILVDNALATMGAGLPSGIAVKMLNPDKEVLVVAGDGGFMMNSQELETAMRLSLDLTILLINDNGLGMIKWEQEEKGYKNFGLDLSNPDFVKYVECYGGKGYRVENVKELKPALEKALNSKGVNLVEVPVDYSENMKVFTHELHEKTCDL